MNTPALGMPPELKQTITALGQAKPQYVTKNFLPKSRSHRSKKMGLFFIS